MPRKASFDELRRTVAVREAAARGIRAVPANPRPSEFPARPFACDVRPARCGACTLDTCPYGQENGTR